MASWVRALQNSTKPSTPTRHKRSASSEKCENASFLSAAVLRASPQYSRNASIHCSDGTSLSFTRTCPSSSTSSPSATIEVLILPGILAHGFGLRACLDSSPNHPHVPTIRNRRRAEWAAFIARDRIITAVALRLCLAVGACAKGSWGIAWQLGPRLRGLALASESSPLAEAVVAPWSHD